MYRSTLPLAASTAAAMVTMGRSSWHSAQCSNDKKNLNSVTVEKQSNITVLYPNKQSFNQKMSRFVKGGSKKLTVVSDFDFTMSRFRIGDARAASCHRLIEGSGFLPEHIVHQADALFNYYYPLEISTAITHEEKVKHMTQWATRAAELMVESGLKKSEIKLAVSEALKSKSFGLRDEVPSFFRTLTSKEVPVLLFSAGIGDIIEETLVQVLGEVPSDVHVVSNHMKFKGEKLVGWTEPVFHVFNKRATAALHSPFFKKYDLEHRNNVLLIGDSMGDIAMSEGLNCSEESVIRVGFLNDKVERLPDYLAVYDVVILGDPSFGVVNSIVNDIVKK